MAEVGKEQYGRIWYKHECNDNFSIGIIGRRLIKARIRFLYGWFKQDDDMI